MINSLTIISSIVPKRSTFRVWIYSTFVDACIMYYNSKSLFVLCFHEEICRLFLLKTNAMIILSNIECLLFEECVFSL